MLNSFNVGSNILSTKIAPIASRVPPYEGKRVDVIVFAETQGTRRCNNIPKSKQSHK